MAIYKIHSFDKVFHALGDPTRRDMVTLLAKGEWRSAMELAAPFDIAQPTASKHIKVLEEAQLVERSVEGRTHYFRLRPRTLNSATSWISRQTRFWAASMDRLEQYAAALDPPKNKER